MSDAEIMVILILFQSENFHEHKDNKAFFKEVANRIAKETSVPVIVTDGNREYEEMENMIN